MRGGLVPCSSSSHESVAVKNQEEFWFRTGVVAECVSNVQLSDGDEEEQI